MLKILCLGIFTRPTEEIAEKYGYSDIYIKAKNNTKVPETEEGKEILRQYNEYIEEVESELTKS